LRRGQEPRLVAAAGKQSGSPRFHAVAPLHCSLLLRYRQKPFVRVPAIQTSIRRGDHMDLRRNEECAERGQRSRPGLWALLLLGWLAAGSSTVRFTPLLGQIAAKRYIMSQKGRPRRKGGQEWTARELARPEVVDREEAGLAGRQAVLTGLLAPTRIAGAGLIPGVAHVDSDDTSAELPKRRGAGVRLKYWRRSRGLAAGPFTT
jgi:hypothetical protein